MDQAVSLLGNLGAKVSVQPVAAFLFTLWLGLVFVNTSPLLAHSTTEAPTSGLPVSEQSPDSTAAQHGPHGQDIRTVTIGMQQLSFDRKTISVTAGEQVRFVIRNTSDLPHDFTLGTSQVQQDRRFLLRVLAEANLLEKGTQLISLFDTADAVFVAPGETKQLIWKFSSSGEIEFGCNLPLHYEAGMKGSFSIAPDDPQGRITGSADRLPLTMKVLPRRKPKRVRSYKSGDTKLKVPPLPRTRPFSHSRSGAPLRQSSQNERRIVQGRQKTSVNYNIATTGDRRDYGDRGSHNSDRAKAQGAVSVSGASASGTSASGGSGSGGGVSGGSVSGGSGSGGGGN